ncbi:MAG TPA: RdgB/HAM1 family non-canonical purine NTP pyrophosphatase [Candidatus Binatia bacterium]|nr:RdgB/HAM1 family non-canonical purine NTP pyrophosphatase [Candidatus Binatia bacterium]
MIPSRLVLATANPGKMRELHALVGAWGAIEVRSLAEFPDVRLPEETGLTYAENALLKARAAAAATNLPALADDSGLEVDALAGAPGVRSARYAPSDAERIARVLAALDGIEDRRARFRCVVVLAWPDGRTESAEGVCAGRIAERPDGAAGFGFDPIFVSDELGRTFAAATAGEKGRVSHRARAVRALGASLAAGSGAPSDS